MANKQKPHDKHEHTPADETFNDMFTKCIRGELNNADDPRGGYSQREGYRKVPNPGQGPFEGGTMWHGLDDIGQGKGQDKK